MTDRTKGADTKFVAAWVSLLNLLQGLGVSIQGLKSPCTLNKTISRMEEWVRLVRAANGLFGQKLQLVRRFQSQSTYYLPWSLVKISASQSFARVALVRPVSNTMCVCTLLYCSHSLTDSVCFFFHPFCSYSQRLPQSCATCLTDAKAIDPSGTT